MKPFRKNFEIRWSDLDPNRHVANASFVGFMSHMRMSYLYENGFTQDYFERHHLGPVVLKEDFFYFKEVLPAEKVTIDLRMLGITDDKRFIRWEHSLFRENGEIAVYSTILFCWIDLRTRKIMKAPVDLEEAILKVEKSPEFRMLQREDLARPSVAGRTLEK